jgi:hypothetical protein
MVSCMHVAQLAYGLKRFAQLQLSLCHFASAEKTMVPKSNGKVRTSSSNREVVYTACGQLARQSGSLGWRVGQGDRKGGSSSRLV